MVVASCWRLLAACCVGILSSRPIPPKKLKQHSTAFKMSALNANLQIFCPLVSSHVHVIISKSTRDIFIYFTYKSMCAAVGHVRARLPQTVLDGNCRFCWCSYWKRVCHEQAINRHNCVLWNTRIDWKQQRAIYGFFVGLHVNSSKQRGTNARKIQAHLNDVFFVSFCLLFSVLKSNSSMEKVFLYSIHFNMWWHVWWIS